MRWSTTKDTKSALLKKLESVQNLPSSYEEASCDCVHLFDGGLLIHFVLSQTNAGSTFASTARSILSLVCSSKGREIHLCFDKYLESSIKGCERKLRGAFNAPFCITGPHQFIRQRGQRLLTNGIFKDQLGQFLVKEWQQDYYWNIYQGKILFASYGGNCFQYVPNESKQVTIIRPTQLQGEHEEADTLIAFHVSQNEN